MVVSSEIWKADLAYYKNARDAALRGIAGAKTIYEDLSPRFPGGGGPEGGGSGTAPATGTVPEVAGAK